MKKVRVGVFETNSSSSHSISIATDQDLKYHIKKVLNKIVLDHLPIDNLGTCSIYSGEFGWEEQTYNDAAAKASYCLTWAKQYGNKQHLDMLKRVIKEFTNAKRVKFVKSGSDSYPWGYIDHQSDGIAAPAFASDTTLECFIFNTESWLKTDNDNH